MLRISIRNTTKHTKRHMHIQLQISECHLYLIPRSSTPTHLTPVRFPQAGGVRIPPLPQEWVLFTRTIFVGQVGALIFCCPLLYSSPTDPGPGGKALHPGGVADLLPLQQGLFCCVRNLFAILCLLFNFADGCLPLYCDHCGAKTLMDSFECPQPLTDEHTELIPTF